jgi:Zn-dependent peptidase ImmA (M78 family)/DNA-binding XRE family transcriptional regulator
LPELTPDPLGPPRADRFRLARELRGMTQREVVDAMGGTISAPAVSQLESGRMRPSPATVEALASALHVPQGFFSAQWPEASAHTFFRDLRSTSVRERRRAAAQTLLLSNFIAALGQHIRMPEVDVPEMPMARGATRDEIERAAQTIRREWRLGTEPITHVVRELERRGIAVARLTMGHQSMDAFSIWTPTRPLVLLADDKSDNYVRSRFDAAHELGHLVMHRGTEPGTKEVEGQAHNFASSLLLPESVAREVLPTKLDAAGWAQLAELKRTWGISMAALLFRARALRVLSPDAYQAAVRYMSSRGWRNQEPGDREMGAPEAPLLLERSVRRAAIEAGMSIQDLVASAQLPVDDLLELLEAAVDDRPTIEL